MPEINTNDGECMTISSNRWSRERVDRVVSIAILTGFTVFAGEIMRTDALV